MENKVNYNEEILVLVEHHILDMSKYSWRNILLSTDEVSQADR